LGEGSNDVVIVGGGLVGSLLALFLADRGRQVDVYERRADLRREGAAGGRSINLVLTRRGIRALGRVDLDRAALRLSIPVHGRMIHAKDGELTFQPYGRDESECNYSISRAGLNAFLVEAAERRGARYHFEQPLVGADLETGRLRFEDRRASGGVRELTAASIFGTDGAGSALRDAYAELPDFECSTEFIEHGYKELTIPAGELESFRIEKHALHIWPRGGFMLMALPNLDGSFTATLYLPWRGEHGFDRLETADDVRALFRDHFADAIPLLPDLVDEFFANPSGQLGTVRCAPWNYRDRALLLGDAAHAIVPFFGQGMNSGFEDCTELARLLDADPEGAPGASFERFARGRKPDADAIARMALENFVEMRDRVGDSGFLLRKQVEHRLEQAMPERYRSRYSMVMYSHIPFHVAFEAGEIQRGLLDELCAGLGSADDLDLDAAARRIDERLAPHLRAAGVTLDY
jgi:kynurenine 3-monooxygenase